MQDQSDIVPTSTIQAQLLPQERQLQSNPFKTQHQAFVPLSNTSGPQMITGESPKQKTFSRPLQRKLEGDEEQGVNNNLSSNQRRNEEMSLVINDLSMLEVTEEERECFAFSKNRLQTQNKFNDTGPNTNQNRQQKGFRLRIEGLQSQQQQREDNVRPQEDIGIMEEFASNETHQNHLCGIGLPLQNTKKFGGATQGINGTQDIFYSARSGNQTKNLIDLGSPNRTAMVTQKSPHQNEQIVQQPENRKESDQASPQCNATLIRQMPQPNICINIQQLHINNAQSPPNSQPVIPSYFGGGNRGGSGGGGGAGNPEHVNLQQHSLPSSGENINSPTHHNYNNRIFESESVPVNQGVLQGALSGINGGVPCSSAPAGFGNAGSMMLGNMAVSARTISNKVHFTQKQQQVVAGGELAQKRSADFISKFQHQIRQNGCLSPQHSDNKVKMQPFQMANQNPSKISMNCPGSEYKLINRKSEQTKMQQHKKQSHHSQQRLLTSSYFKIPKGAQMNNSPYNKKNAGYRKKSLISKGDQKAKNNNTFAQDEEEKVPNEHPIKRNSIGLGFYQTNYFSQGIDSQHQLQEQQERHNDMIVNKREGTLDSKEEEKNCKLSNEMIGLAGNIAKKRQPTLMPYNLPGDELDQIEKQENKIKPKVQLIGLPHRQQQQMEITGLLSGAANPLMNAFDIVGDSEFNESENFKTEDHIIRTNEFQKQQYANSLNRGQKLLNKDPQEMSQSELIQEVEFLRKELRNKELKMKKVTLEGQRLKRKTQQLSLKLQFEQKNNSLLLKNLNRMRHNYFQCLNSPTNVRINSAFQEQQPQPYLIQPQQQLQRSNLKPQRQIRSTNNNDLAQSAAAIGAVSLKLQRCSQNRTGPITFPGQAGVHNEKPNINQQRLSQISPPSNNPNEFQNMSSPLLQLPENNTFNLNRVAQLQLNSNAIQSEPSEQSSGLNGSSNKAENAPAQIQQTMAAPARVSQGIEILEESNTLRDQQQNMGNSLMQPRGNGRRQNLQTLMRYHHQRRHHTSRLVPSNIDEDASLLETQHNDESILINKVNEMQIKTSRFDQPFLHFHHSRHMGTQNYYRNDELIPNEEPLINVREFWDGEFSHNYRMRWPYNQQQALAMANCRNQLRMRVPTMGIYERQRYPQAFFQLHGGNIVPVRNAQAINNQYGSRRGRNAPDQSLGNNNVPLRRIFGVPTANNIIHQQVEPAINRIRVASHGPPLRNINGDSHSLLEEDILDQSHQHFVANQNNSNLIISASGNPIGRKASQLQLQHQYHSDDSVLDFEEEEKHQALPMRNHQMFLQFNNRGGFGSFHPMGPGTSGPMAGLHAGGFSFDDGGMDEYDVADERAHLWEFINPDNMTYEEIIALQDRIGYVSKGLTLNQIGSFPKMKRKEVAAYLQKQLKGKHSQDQEESKHKKEKSKKVDLEEIKGEDLNSIKIKNPLSFKEEAKHSMKKKKRSNLNIRRSATNGEEEFDEVIDGDEGIVNRRLPLNSYNHQIQVEDHQINPQGPKKQYTANFGHNHQIKSIIRQNDDEEGIENCKEEDEERKDGELIEQSLSRHVLKEKDNGLIMDLSNNSIMMDFGNCEPHPHNLSMGQHSDSIIMNNNNNINEELKDNVMDIQLSHVQSESKESSNTQQTEKCAVCFDTMMRNDVVKVLTCGHYYHIDCIDQWLLLEKRCPMCMMYLDNSNSQTKKEAPQMSSPQQVQIPL